jgi:signal transduction histidine kinase
VTDKKQSILNRFQSTWRRLTAPRAIEPDEKIREHMTRVVLLMQGIALSVFTLPIIIGWISGPFSLEAPLIMFALLAPTLIGFWLANRGWWHYAGLIPPSLFSVLGLYFSYQIPLGLTPILFFILASILASMLLEKRIYWLVVGFNLLAYFVLGAGNSQESIQDIIQAFIIIGGIFTGITLLQGFSTSQFRQSIQNLNSEISRRKEAEGEKDLLLEQVQLANERLRGLSQELITSQEMERMQIAEQLHEGLGQALTEISLDLGVIERDLRPETVLDSGQRLLRVRALANELDQRISRLAFDLRPSLLDHLGLIPTLKWYIDKFSQQVDMDIELDISGLENNLSPEIEITLYRVFQEALTNAASHGRASKLRLKIEGLPTAVAIWIEDNGFGFDTKEFETKVSRGGFGLAAMKERINLLGGNLAIRSQPGEGTRIEIEIPF